MSKARRLTILEAAREALLPWQKPYLSIEPDGDEYSVNGQPVTAEELARLLDHPGPLKVYLGFNPEDV